MPTANLLDTLKACGLSGPTWFPWHTAAKVLTAQPLTRDEQALYEQCTHRTRPPTEPPAEFWIIKGRRAGGSRFSGATVVHAARQRYDLAPGETAVIACAGADREQGRVLLNYSTAPFREVPDLRGMVARRSGWEALRALVARETRWGIDLLTGVSIEVHTSHFGRIRGRTFAQANADEVAFWQAEDGSNPGSEVIAAIRPGLATLNGQLIVTSSPFAKSGPLWDIHTRYYGRDDPRIVVWQASTRTMNATIPEALVLDALERDPESAKAEWLGEFRDDLSALVSDVSLRSCIIPGRGELGWNPQADYLAFTDASTGSGQDSMTLAIAHIEQEAVEGNSGHTPGRLIAVIDLLLERRPPFSPEDAVKEFASAIQSFGGLSVVHGDKFAQGWTDAAFRRHHITYEASPLSKSELYLAMLALINSKQVELPDAPRLLQQLSGLQRRPTGGGRESVDHASRLNAHDDLANVAAGASVLAYRMATNPAPKIVLV